MNRLDFMAYVQWVYRCNDIGLICSLEKKYDIPNIIVHPLENVLLSLVTHRKDVLRRKQEKRYTK